MFFQILPEQFGEFSPNYSKVWKFHFDWLFLSKVYHISAKKIQSILYIIKLYLDGPFLPKVYNVSSKKIQRILYIVKLYIDGLFLSKVYNVSSRMCHDTEGWCKFKGKLTRGLENDIKNLNNFHASSRESTEELSLMTLNCDVKFEEKLTLGSKNDVWTLVNFNASSDKSENLYFDVLLLSIAHNVLAKRYRRIISHATEEWSKLWLFLWKITILTRVVESLKNCTLTGFFCQKYVMFELKNTDELCREKWLMVSKMT